MKTKKSHAHTMEGGAANKPKPPRNPRKRNNNNRRRGGGGTGSSNKPSGSSSNTVARGGPPSPPQLRVTCRNISNAEQYGTTQQLRPLIESILSKANEKLLVKMELDQEALEIYIRNEEAATKAKEEFEQLQQNSANEKMESEQVQEEGSKGETPEDKETTPTVTAPVVNEAVKAQEHDENSIKVLILYTVPPKKTRRRGEKPGCVYLLLQAPAFPKQPPPAVVAGEEEGSAAPSPLPQYSVELSKRRTMLAKAVEAMTIVAAEDAKTTQEYAGAVISESLGQKTWKRASAAPNDRFEGTIFTTPSYKAFFDTKQREAEERSARPRPAPGGIALGVAPSTGASASMSSCLPGAAAVTEDGHLVSNLVQYLLFQNRSQKERKKVMTKKTPAGKYSSANKNSFQTLQAPPKSSAATKKGPKKKNSSKPRAKKVVVAGKTPTGKPSK